MQVCIGETESDEHIFVFDNFSQTCIIKDNHDENDSAGYYWS